MIGAEQRERFRRLADLILPGGQGLPPACEVDVAGRLLNRTLTARPELVAPLAELLDRADVSPSAIEGLLPTDHDLLLLVTAGSYLLAPAVRAALGYPGQEAQEPPRGGCGVEELALELMQVGPRWRDPEAVP